MKRNTARGIRRDPGSHAAQTCSPPADASFQYEALNRVTNMVDAAGTTAYGYAAGGQLWTEDGPWSSDTVTTINDPDLNPRYGHGCP